MRKSEVFANSCDAEARWREDKADEYGDQRNQQTADALNAAALWARMSDDAEEILDLLPDEVFTSDFLSLSEDGRQIFSTYCFHSPEPLQDWLHRMAFAELDDRSSEDDPTEPLGDEQS